MRNAIGRREREREREGLPDGLRERKNEGLGWVGLVLVCEVLGGFLVWSLSPKLLRGSESSSEKLYLLLLLLNSL